jgi:hypothetical protein
MWAKEGRRYLESGLCFYTAEDLGDGAIVLRILILGIQAGGERRAAYTFHDADSKLRSDVVARDEGVETIGEGHADAMQYRHQWLQGERVGGGRTRCPCRARMQQPLGVEVNDDDEASERVSGRVGWRAFAFG